MTNPIPMDALDVWWAEHFGGDRYQPMNGSLIDMALANFNTNKELQRQGRAPEGYDLDNPALIECAAKAESARAAAWEDGKQHGAMTPDGDNSGKTPNGDTEPLPPKRRRRK